MFILVLIISFLMSALLITMVLLQPSKGGGLGASFGGFGGTLGSTFGTRRTLDFLAKATTWVAIAIAVLAVIANMFLQPGTGTEQRNVFEGVSPTAPQTVPPVVPPAPPSGAQQTAPADAGDAPVDDAAGAPPPSGE